MAKKDIKYICDRCGGSGLEDGTDPITGEPASVPDPKCDGSGSLMLGFLDDALLDDIDTIKDDVDMLKDMVQQILDFHGIT